MAQLRDFRTAKGPAVEQFGSRGTKQSRPSDGQTSGSSAAWRPRSRNLQPSGSPGVRVAKGRDTSIPGRSGSQEVDSLNVQGPGWRAVRLVRPRLQVSGNARGRGRLDPRPARPGRLRSEDGPTRPRRRLRDRQGPRPAAPGRLVDRRYGDRRRCRGVALDRLGGQRRKSHPGRGLDQGGGVGRRRRASPFAGDARPQPVTRFRSVTARPGGRRRA
jgi:hypothetical protein